MDIKHLDLYMVNAYLVKTNAGPFLIDTGIALSRSRLLKALHREGVAPGDIKLVVITHGDMDHIGNCAFLQKQYGLKIAIHEADADLCRTGKINSSRKRKSSPGIFRKVLFALLLKPVMKKFPLETFEPDRILSDGQDFGKSGFDAKVIFIPGHTMGSIGILTGEGDFFSGDTINNRKKPTVADIVENEASLASSLEKIKKLNIRNVYPGHGKVFSRDKLHF